MAQYTLADGDYPTASILNTYALGEGGAWTSWTPTVTQSGSVTVTNTRSRYARYGRTIHVTVSLAVTGSGTSSNAILVSLPVTAATSSAVAIGGGYVTDSTAGPLNYPGLAYLNSTTTVGLLSSQSTALGLIGTVDMTAALASGDSIFLAFTYEAAS